jgi:hypothetical protein
MKNATILLEAYPKGKFLTGIISGALLPGIKMQLQLGTAPVGGRHTFEAYNPSADNDPRLLAILLEDDLQGVALNTAYTSGRWGRMYDPLIGEEMNVLLKGQAGTASANAFTIGERLSPIHGTGKYQQQLTSASTADFSSMEHLDEVPNVDTLCWVIAQAN